MLEGLISPFEQLIAKLRRLDEDAVNYILTHKDINVYKKYGSLSSMFVWAGTPQGHLYWRNLSDNLYNVPDITPKGNVVTCSL